MSLSGTLQGVKIRAKVSLQNWFRVRVRYALVVRFKVILRVRGKTGLKITENQKKLIRVNTCLNTTDKNGLCAGVCCNF